MVEESLMILIEESLSLISMNILENLSLIKTKNSTFQRLDLITRFLILVIWINTLSIFRRFHLPKLLNCLDFILMLKFSTLQMQPKIFGLTLFKCKLMMYQLVLELTEKNILKVLLLILSLNFLNVLIFSILQRLLKFQLQLRLCYYKNLKDLTSFFLNYMNL